MTSWTSSFMKSQITHDEWWFVDDDSLEDQYYPASLFSKEEVFSMHQDQVTREQIILIKGYGARLSAPGYLDCTSWCVFDTEEEAQEYLVEAYGDDE